MPDAPDWYKKSSTTRLVELHQIGSCNNSDLFLYFWLLKSKATTDYVNVTQRLIKIPCSISALYGVQSVNVALLALAYPQIIARRPYVDLHMAADPSAFLDRSAVRTVVTSTHRDREGGGWPRGSAHELARTSA